MRTRKDPKYVSCAPHNRSEILKVIVWGSVSNPSSMARSQHDMARQCTCLPRPPVADT